MLNAIIIVNENAEDLYELFKLEDKKFQNERANYTLKKKDDKLELIVSAKDSVALRSALNTITKIITVHEKVGAIVENGKRN